jgi:hypothetical protein
MTVTLGSNPDISQKCKMGGAISKGVADNLLPAKKITKKQKKLSE